MSDELILKHLGLVSEVLHSLKSIRYYPDQQGLTGAGNLALVEAARSYNPNRGIPFRPYAFVVIRQKMIDEVKSNYPGKGHARVRLAKRIVAEDTLLNQGKEITPATLAQELELSPSEVNQLLTETTPKSLLSIEYDLKEYPGKRGNLLDTHPLSSAEDEYLRIEMIELVRRGVAQLPYPYLKPIILATFYEGRTQRDIAGELGIIMGSIHVYVRLAKDHLRKFLIQEYYKTKVMT